MTRRITETYDPQDFLLYATPGHSAIQTTGLLDFEAFVNTGNGSFSSIVILSDTPTETYGGIFYQYQEPILTTTILIRFKQDDSLLGYLRVNGGNDKLELVTGEGVIRAVGTHNIQAFVNYHIQWHYKVSGSVGIFEVKLDEDLDILTWNGNTTGAAIGGTFVNRYEFPPVSSGSKFDSLYINDTAGSEDNGYGGIVKMKSFVPTADGFWEQWLMTSGSNGFAMLNQTPHDGDSTIIYSNVDGDKSSFICPGHGLLAPSEITAVSARWVVRKISDGRVRPFFRIDSTDYPIAAASVPVGVGYGVVMDRRTTNPDTGLAWVLGDTIDSFGLESVL